MKKTESRVEIWKVQNNPFSGQTSRAKITTEILAKMKQSHKALSAGRLPDGNLAKELEGSFLLMSQSPFSGQTFRGHSWNPPSIQGKNCHFNETQFFSQKILPKSYKNHPKPPSVRLVGDLPFPNVSNP